MDFIVRQMGAGDRAIWAEMRTALWPDETSLTHAKMVNELLGDGDSLSLIAEATEGIALGFAEIAVRKYTNGCMACRLSRRHQTAIQAAGYWKTAASTRGKVASGPRSLFAKLDQIRGSTIVYRKRLTWHGDFLGRKVLCIFELKPPRR